MIAIGYIRVSTVGQAAEGVSLDAQREKIRAWCSANGYTLTDVFSDAGISAKRADNREGLQQALDSACRHSGTALIVYSLSRLARSTKDAIGIAERLDKAGADLVSLSERIDTTSAAGRMIFRMLAVLAEFEADLVSERTTEALAHLRRNGQRTGSVPFGFDLSENDNTLIANKREQCVIGEILAMRSNGMTLQRIAAELTARGIPTKKGRSKSWSHQSVARIVHRKTESQTPTSPQSQ